MKTIGTIFVGILSVIAMFSIIISIGFIAQGTDFFMYKFFAPKYENVRRETFENTKSYIQGTIQDMRSFQREYVSADDNQKNALKTIFNHRFADFPEDKIPNDLKDFVNQMRKVM